MNRLITILSYGFMLTLLSGCGGGGSDDTSNPPAPSETVTPTEPETVTEPEPSETVTPTEPSETVTPTEPSETVTPTEPSETVTPTEPSETVTPTEPSETVTPTGTPDAYKASSATNVVDCSTLTSEIGAGAVAVLAKYNYTKCAIPFGILVANSNTGTYLGNDMTAVTKLQASIVAELLDNNQDGVLDNPAVAQRLKSSTSQGVWMNIQSKENETNEDIILEEMNPYIARDMGVKHTWMAMSDTQSEDYEEENHFKTMMAEEAIHMLHHKGFSDIYPTVWGVNDDSCNDSEASSAGCDWEQSTLTKLTYEAMTSESKWYRHPENSLADASGIITGTCSTPGCASVEFIMNVMVELRDIKPAASELDFPSTKAELETKLRSTTKGQAMKSVIEDTQYAQFPKGLTYSYNPTTSTSSVENQELTPATVKSKATKITSNTQGRDEATFETSHTFVSIPATTFTMGDSKYEVLGASPEHQVRISKEYWISKNLITNAQFNTFVQETNYISDLQKDSSEGCFVYDTEELGFVPTQGRYYANAFSNTSSLSNHPVVCISYNDATAYAAWLSTKLSLNVSLATEAQWELAAKGTSQKKFPWGDSAPDATKVNFADLQFSIDYAGSSQGHPNTEINDGYGATSPVGNYPEGASEFGVMDMAGNAAEWVNDYYSEYSSASLTDPAGATTGDSRVNRGGNWVDDASATEDQHTIILVSRASDSANSADDHMGFRVVINP